MTLLVPQHPAAAADLATFARRIARFEADAVIRIIADGAVAGCFAETPFDALALRAVALAESLSADVVVEAGTLAARAVGEDGEVELPPALPALRWTSSLPPGPGGRSWPGCRARRWTRWSRTASPSSAAVGRR